MTETLAHGYSSEGTQQELSNEYQHDRVKMDFINVCVLVLWTRVASALGGPIVWMQPRIDMVILLSVMFCIVDTLIYSICPLVRVRMLPVA